ncbi:CCA-adding enzyme [Candidatus Tiddalikarchaeum anstoanum]|nr:CCA-adding enzyme [Candidatus Tiddalikarchaeum anstoanum]
MEDVFKKVLSRVNPTAEEIRIVSNIEKEIISKLEKESYSNNLDAEIVLGGSASRGTFMSGNHDLDFFFRFKNEDDIKNYYRNIVEKCFENLVLMHGTRDYFKFKYKGYEIEVIPSVKYDSPSKAKNTADISFFHINYLRKKFEKNPEMRKEVLLLKQFLKANELYGAESAKNGFSGYASELLIVYFKTFKNLMDFFENNKPKIILDIEKYYKDDKDVLKHLGETKSNNPLIIVDPLLPKRNAAASVSYDIFSNFVFRIRQFLRQPLIKLFNTRGLSISLVLERSNRRGTKVYDFKLKPDRNEYDIFKAKLLSKMKQLKKELETEGWLVYSFGICDEKIAYFELETIKNSKAKKHFGPFVWADAKDFDKFFQKWQVNALGKPYVENNKLIVDVFRKEDIEQSIKNYLKDYLL